MTRQAVADGFTDFIDDIIEVALSEFDFVAALSGQSFPGGRTVSNLLRNNRRLHTTVVQPELRRYRDLATEQFEVLLDYATDEGADYAEYHDDVLATDPMYGQLREDLPHERRTEVARAVLGRQRALIRAARPLVDSPETEFWAAALDSLTPQEGRELVERHFTFTEPLREFPDAFRFAVAVDVGDLTPGPIPTPLPTVTVGYTGEATRVLQEAEAEVVEQTLDEVGERFD